MNTLSNVFCDAILKIGMCKIEHPIFYNTPIGIRFEIGGEEPIYLENARGHTVNPEYIGAAFERAMSIYLALPHPPSLLRIDGYPDASVDLQAEIQTICSHAHLPLPHEQTVQRLAAEGEEQIEHFQLYWDLSLIDFLPNQLLKEIIKGDIGGYSGFVSSVYFLNEHDDVLYHLYDDRGLDVVAADKGTIRSLFERFNDWILDHDREKICYLFST